MTTIINELKQRTNSLYNWLELKSNERFWSSKVVLFCVLLFLIFSFPDIQILLNNLDFYKAIDYQSAHMLEKNIFSEVESPITSHIQKVTFRLFVPALLNLLHLSSFNFFIIQNILVIPFLYITYAVFLKCTNDKVTSSLLTVGICFTFLANSFSWNLPFYDCIAFLFLTIMLYTNSNLLLLALTIMVSFIDERACLSSILVIIFFKFKDEGVLTFKRLITPDIKSITIIAGLSIYMLVRLFLQHQYNLDGGLNTGASDVGLPTVVKNFNKIPVGLFFAYEGFWLLIILAAFVMLFQRKNLQLATFLISTFGVLFLSFIVFDITRSTTYSFISFFTSLLILKKASTTIELRNISFLVLTGSFVIPTFYIYGGFGWMGWIAPYLLISLKHIF